MNISKTNFSQFYSQNNKKSEGPRPTKKNILINSPFKKKLLLSKKKHSYRQLHSNPFTSYLPSGSIFHNCQITHFVNPKKKEDKELEELFDKLIEEEKSKIDFHDTTSYETSHSKTFTYSFEEDKINNALFASEITDFFSDDLNTSITENKEIFCSTSEKTEMPLFSQYSPSLLDSILQELSVSLFRKQGRTKKIRKMSFYHFDFLVLQQVHNVICLEHPTVNLKNSISLHFSHSPNIEIEQKKVVDSVNTVCFNILLKKVKKLQGLKKESTLTFLFQNIPFYTKTIKLYSRTPKTSDFPQKASQIIFRTILDDFTQIKKTVPEVKECEKEDIFSLLNKKGLSAYYHRIMSLKITNHNEKNIIHKYRKIQPRIRTYV